MLIAIMNAMELPASSLYIGLNHDREKHIKVHCGEALRRENLRSAGGITG
jgi:hypothetical protein